MGGERKNTLILGLGNLLLGDDRLGLLLVEDLQKNSRLRQKASFFCSSQSGLYLLDLLIGYQCVIFIDTISCAREAAGQVQRIALKKSAATVYGSSPHYIGIHSMIALGNRLHLNMPKELWLIGITVNEGLQIEEGLSKEIQKKYGEILKKVEREVLDIFSIRPLKGARPCRASMY